MGCFKLDILAENSPQFLRVVGEKDVDEIALDSNHLGNVLAVVSDLKIIDNGAYTTTTLAATDYYPFGMTMPNRTFSSPDYRYGYQGSEKDDEVKGAGNSYTTMYRQLDSRIGRWLSPDPLASSFPYSSPYVSMNCNPIAFTDRGGDSSVVDNKGYMLHYDAEDKDLRVFMKSGDDISLIGELGKEIDANRFIGNLFKENSKEADGIIWPFTFRNNVKQYGKWDYKYRSPANENETVKKMSYHILGIAFYRTDKEKGAGDLKETIFKFEKERGRPQDYNQAHFGVVGNSYGLFSEVFMLKRAGSAEMGKWAEDYEAGIRDTPRVPEKWRPTITIQESNPPPCCGSSGGGGTHPREILLPPYGDHPTDHEWIKKGFRYYNFYLK